MNDLLKELTDTFLGTKEQGLIDVILEKKNRGGVMKIVEEGMELERCSPGGRGALDSLKNLHASDAVWLEDEGHTDQQEMSLER